MAVIEKKLKYGQIQNSNSPESLVENFRARRTKKCAILVRLRKFLL